MTEVNSITSEDQFTQFVAQFPSTSLLVIYFHAPWAAPCKQMAQVLDTLASTYPVESPPKIGFIAVDAEDLPSISEAYNVVAVPFVVLVRDGKTLDSISGSNAAKVREAVERHAGNQSSGSQGGDLPPAQTVTRPPEGQEPTPPIDIPNGVHKTAANGQAIPTEKPKQADKDVLFKRLETLVKAAPVMLFMKGTPSSPQCGFSRQLVGMLRDRSVRYGFFNILADDDVRQGLKEFSDWPTFPQLYVEGELVGGLDIVREELDNNPDFLMEHSVSSQKKDAPPVSTEPSVQTS